MNYLYKKAYVEKLKNIGTMPFGLEENPKTEMVMNHFKERDAAIENAQGGRKWGVCDFDAKLASQRELDKEAFSNNWKMNAALKSQKFNPGKASRDDWNFLAKGGFDKKHGKRPLASGFSMDGSKPLGKRVEKTLDRKSYGDYQKGVLGQAFDKAKGVFVNPQKRKVRYANTPMHPRMQGMQKIRLGEGGGGNVAPSKVIAGKAPRKGADKRILGEKVSIS